MFTRIERRGKWLTDNIKNTFTPLSEITAKDPTRTVVTDSMIAFEAKFGPYPGKDAVQAEFSNWMQFVTGVQNLDEANLVIFICESQLYFICIRAIHPGMELFVWAGTNKNHLMENQWLERESRRAVHKLTFLCQVCDSTFSSHHGLFTHWSWLHRPKDLSMPRKQCKCPYCPKIISCRSNLRSHVLLHLGIRRNPLHPITSNQNKMFARYKARIQNARLSSKDKLIKKPISCKICGMQFKVAANLANHSRYSHGPKNDEGYSRGASISESSVSNITEINGLD